MQVAVNAEYVRSRQSLIQRTLLIGFFFLTASVVIVLLYQQLIFVAWPLMIIGYIITSLTRQIQFDLGQNVRTDQRLATALKSLSNRYWLGNWIPVGSVIVDGILVGPEGVLVIETRNHGGVTECNGNKWKRRKNILVRFFTGEPSLGNPSIDLQASLEAITKDLQEAGFGNVPVSGAVVFTSPDAVLMLDDCKNTALTSAQLLRWANSRQVPSVVISDATRQKIIEHFSAKITPAKSPAQQEQEVKAK